MGFLSTEEKIVEVTGVIERNANEFKIYGMNIRIDPNAPEKLMIVVDYGQGYTESGVFMCVKRNTYKLTGGPILSAITKVVAEGNTRYDEIKTGIWETLLAEGVIPSGEIE